MTPEAAVQGLEGLILLAEEAGAEGVTRDARALLDRTHEGRFFVACLGQFKRGKSTVINALVGEAILPSGVAPVTSVVTVVRFGERSARVRFGSEEWRSVPVEELRLYVSEEHNPQNAKRVTAVEVFCPSGLLESGLCLVDTPGIGSVFAGNTEETRSFVPQIDAAVLVLGGDPPISGDELALVAVVSKHVHDLLFVLNKADRLPPRELQEARTFTESVLMAHRSPPPALLEISGLERLERRGPPRQWPVLVGELEKLARASGRDLVAQAAKRGAETVVARLRQHLVEGRDALRRSVEESEQRLNELRRCAASAEQSLVELTHLLNAEHQKLVARFDADGRRFLESALPRVTAVFNERFAGVPIARGPGLRRHAIGLAQELTEQVVRAWMDEERPVAEREFAAVTERLVTHANAFLGRLRTSGDLSPGALPEMLLAESCLRARSRYCFHSFMTLTSPPMWTWLSDWLRTVPSAQARAGRAGLDFAQRLLEVNTRRVVGDLNERVVESRRGVEWTLRQRLQELVVTAENAARRASELREKGAAAVQEEVGAIDARLARLERLEGGSATSRG